MITALAFIGAAAAGTLARAAITRRLNHPDALPLGTLVVNVTGAFLLGLLVDVAPPALTIAGAGALGAFTTFSTFARDAVALVERGRPALAAAYVTATCALGIAAAALGIALAG